MASKNLREALNMTEEKACNKCQFRDMCQVRGMNATAVGEAQVKGDPKELEKAEATVGDASVVLFGLYKQIYGV